MQIDPASTFYVLSDLHIVGGDVKDRFVCEDDLLSFLQEVDADEGAVLLLLGDLFDFWQMNGSPGQRLRAIMRDHQPVFAALARISQSHRIYYVPGNHDRESSWSEEIRTMLTDVGVTTVLDGGISAAALVEGGVPMRFFAEHGHEGDPYNNYEYDPHPAERPFAEHLMRLFINPVKRTETGREESWLRDIDNVHPLAAIPLWLASKYFYIEAGVWIKALAVPAMIVFGLTKIGLILLAAQAFGINVAEWGLPRIPKPLLYTLVGFMGVDAFAAALLVMIYFLRRDALRILRRWGYEDLDLILRQRALRIERAVRHRMRESRADLYVFGHTHEEFLRPLPGGRAFANTGTWVKRMHRIKPRFHLPPVFVPGFRLTYLRIRANESGARVELRARPKPIVPPLTYLERFALLGRPLPRDPRGADELLSCLQIRGGAGQRFCETHGTMVLHARDAAVR